MLTLPRSSLARWTYLFIALNVVDVIETAIGLHLGAHEAMPLYAALLRVAPYAALIPLKLLCASLLMAYALLTRHWWPSWCARVEMQALCALMALAVVANLAVLVMQTR